MQAIPKPFRTLPIVRATGPTGRWIALVAMTVAAACSSDESASMPPSTDNEQPMPPADPAPGINDPMQPTNQGTPDPGNAPPGPSMPGELMPGPVSPPVSMEDGGIPDPMMMADAAEPPAMRAPLSNRELEVTMEAPDEAPYFNLYRPTDLTATGEPLPVIVWANGGCFRADIPWEPLLKRWASAGFVVLSLTASTTNASAGLLSQTSIEDHGALIDWVLEKSGIADQLDADRIVAAGNSCGGITALGLAAADARVAAVFVLSGSTNIGSPNQTVIDGLKVPVGYVVGGPEDAAGANAKLDYAALSPDLPAMVVSRRAGDHVVVSTDAMILPEVAEIGLNWIDLALYGTQGAYDTLHSDDVCETCTPGDWSLESQQLDQLLR